MQIITLQDARLLAWAAQKLKATYSPATCKWVGALDAGGVVWVAVYSHFSERNCAISLATNGSKRWASRATFRTILRIPFVEWGLARVTFVVDERNEASLRMMRKDGRFCVGAREEGRMRAMFDGADGIVFGLLKEECKWI